jgi:multiple sugar transport system permease protein
MSVVTRSNRMPLPVLIAVTVGALVMAAPLIWTLLLSFKGNAALMRDSGAAFSGPYTAENYAAIFQSNMLLRWLLNSFIVSTGTTIGVLAVCSLAGYGFSRLNFPFRRALFVFVLLGLGHP